MSKAPSAPRELAPEGSHNAVCVGFIDIGTQPSEKWGDKRKCNIEFEIQEKKKDGKPFVVALRSTYSSSPKSNLMKTLSAWLGVKDKEYEMDNMLSKQALVTIEHDETGEYANITAVVPAPKGMKPFKPQNPLRSLYIDATFDNDIFESLSDYTKEKIMSSPEYDQYGPEAQQAQKGKSKKKK